MEDNKFINVISWLEFGSDNDRTAASVSKKLKVIDDAHMGRCIFAVDKIEKNATLVNIPKRYLLNYVTVLKYLSFFNTAIDQFLKDNIQNFNKDLFQTESDEITTLYSQFNCRMILKLSSHQLLTLFITLENRRNERSFWNPLLSCFPQMKEYSGIPMTWNLKMSSESEKKLFNALPTSTINHASSQIDQYTSDITTINTILDGTGIKIPDNEFLWSWLAINTRCLYYKLPSYLPITETKNKEASNITMVPFVDFINHRCNGSNSVAKETKSGYEVLSTDKIENNHHLWFTYGPHNDEFLQCEYGFSEPQMESKTRKENLNIYNCVDISPIILKLLKSPKKANVLFWLEQTSYYGDYTLGIEDNSDRTYLKEFKVRPSHRTRIAIASLIENDADFKMDKTQGNVRCPLKLEKFYEGYNDGEHYQKTETVLLQKIIAKIKEDLQKRLESLNDIKNIDSSKVAIVQKLLLNQLYLLNSF